MTLRTCTFLSNAYLFLISSYDYCKSLSKGITGSRYAKEKAMVVMKKPRELREVKDMINRDQGLLLLCHHMLYFI